MTRAAVSDPRHLGMRRVDAEAAGAPPSKRSVYEHHLLEAAIRRKAGVDLLRYLSELAKQTRRPGQTLQSRLNELRRQYEFVAPSEQMSAPHRLDGAAISDANKALDERWGRVMGLE